MATAPGTGRATTTTSTTTNTPFPAEYGGPVQGGADEPLTVSIQEPEGYSDGSIACRKRAAGAMRSHLEDEIESDLVFTGYGESPRGDGMVVWVTLDAKRYGRDGELKEKATIGYATVVNDTPPAVYLRSESGERVCSMPVYVDRVVSHTD